MVFINGGCNCNGGYSWRVSVIRLRVSVRRKERKYNLIWPFWVEIKVEAFICSWEIDFGSVVSSQVRSSRWEAVFWPSARLSRGRERCIIAGKYPRRLENLKGVRGCLNFRSCVEVLRSRAMVKPRMVTKRAANFRWRGIVICGIVVGGMLLEMRNPAKILPKRRRLMEFIRQGSFSLIVIRAGKRGWLRRAKKMIRVL